MNNNYPSLFFLLSIFFFNLPFTIHSICNLDFNQVTFDLGSECFGVKPTPPTCCQSALRPFFMAMAIEANRSRTLYLDPIQAHDCITQFQSLHPRINLNTCEFQNIITSHLPSSNPCSGNVDGMEGSVGIDGLRSVRSSCRDLSIGNYSEDVCFNCADSYRSCLKALEGGGNNDSSGSSSMCGGALLITLASSNIGSMNWIQGLFTCLWDEIYNPRVENHKKGKQTKMLLLVVIIGALALVILALVLYRVTRKRLIVESQKEIEELSVTMRRNSMEYEREMPFSYSKLRVFSREEIARATDDFNVVNLIGEGSTGKIYLGRMANGQNVVIKQIYEDKKVPTFSADINNVSKIKHPNLVTIFGYCNRREHYLVSEYCVNNNLGTWLLGNQDSQVLSWDQRLRIALGIARGLWFLHNYPKGPIVHKDIKLTNILLDGKLEAKILNYGLSKQGNCEAKFEVTLANDVYNYGIILLQLLTGRIIDLNSSGLKSLLIEARSIMKKGGNTCALVDQRLKGNFNDVAFERVLSMALLCTSTSQDERPTLEDIIRKLQEAQSLAKQGGPAVYIEK